jgi:ADP-ribose pyrophosphatase YjhB (NUDIX family)
MRSPEVELIARGVLIRRARILLCKSIKHQYLYLPGGHIEFGEPAKRSLEREFLEECGLAVRATELLVVSEESFDSSRRTHHEVNVVFHVEWPNETRLGAVQSREPGISFEWVPLSDVADRDVRPPSIKAWLAARQSTSSPRFISGLGRSSAQA